MNRKASFSGSFYPSDATEIERYIAHFETVAQDHFDLTFLKDKKIAACVVPHAGYVYSGFTAHLAFKALATQKPKTLVVIGPSHHHYFKGMSIADLDSFETPLGDLPIDKSLVQELQKNFSLAYLPAAHGEHSTEVQMPFIKHYTPKVNVVEIVYSDTSDEKIQLLLAYLLGKKDLIIVISTDLSHFYTLKEANYLDTICVDALKRLDDKRLHDGCEACGKLGLEAMIESARSHHLSSVLLDYRTSADASGDEERVVGYMSGLFIQN